MLEKMHVMCASVVYIDRSTPEQPEEDRGQVRCQKRPCTNSDMRDRLCVCVCAYTNVLLRKSMHVSVLRVNVYSGRIAIVMYIMPVTARRTQPLRMKWERPYKSIC